jgi:GAF domain-containing protein
MNWPAGYLEIKAQQGFQDEFLNFFARVNLSDGSACARALRDRQSIIVEDIMLDQHFAPYREIMTRAGVRAVQSTPLLSSAGALVGIMSMHFPINHRPDDRQIRAVTSAAESAADAILRLRAQRLDGLQSSLKLLAEGRRVIARADKLFQRRQ